jgi:hypothetical protein
MTDKNATPDVPAASLTIRLLTAADILDADDYKYEDVQCPEWKGVVRIRNLTGEGRGVFVSAMSDDKRARDDWGKACQAAAAAQQPLPPRPPAFDAETTLVCMTAVDDTGSPIFSKDHLERLKQKSAAPLQRLAQVAQKLSGLMAEQQETAVKNSEATPS